MPNIFLFVIFSLLPVFVNAETIAGAVGSAIGEFSSGVAGAIGEGMIKRHATYQSHWITVLPKSTEECMKESGGELNRAYMRCRNGRQELVRVDSNGNMLVQAEQSIPIKWNVEIVVALGLRCECPLGSVFDQGAG